jgi:hypothetical protein
LPWRFLALGHSFEQASIGFLLAPQGVNLCYFSRPLASFM